MVTHYSVAGESNSPLSVPQSLRVVLDALADCFDVWCRHFGVFMWQSIKHLAAFVFDIPGGGSPVIVLHTVSGAYEYICDFLNFLCAHEMTVAQLRKMQFLSVATRAFGRTCMIAFGRRSVPRYWKI